MNTADRTPLEWGDLWAAMKADPSAWILTTEAMYWNQLEVVPPRQQTRDAFLVGEAHSHNDRGQAVYACFVERRGQFFARHLTLAEFNTGAWRAA